MQSLFYAFTQFHTNGAIVEHKFGHQAMSLINSPLSSESSTYPGGHRSRITIARGSSLHTDHSLSHCERVYPTSTGSMPMPVPVPAHGVQGVHPKCSRAASVSLPLRRRSVVSLPLRRRSVSQVSSVCDSSLTLCELHRSVGGFVFVPSPLP